jgi:hypothetical protein
MSYTDRANTTKHEFRYTIPNAKKLTQGFRTDKSLGV